MAYFTESITVTTDSSGDATAYIPSGTAPTGSVSGEVSLIAYTKTDYATGVDFAITSETTGQTLWTENNVDATKAVSPSQALADTAGAAVTDPARGPISLVGERVQIVISNGGDTKSGAFRLVVR